MKRRTGVIVCAIIAVFVLCSCGSGITQEEYDKVVAERDEAIAELQNVQNSNELQAVADRYKAVIDSDYEWYKAVYGLMEIVGSERYDTSGLDDLYNNTISSIDGIVSMQTQVNEITSDSEGLSSDEMQAAAIASIDGMYEAWNETVVRFRNTIQGK